MHVAEAQFLYAPPNRCYLKKAKENWKSIHVDTFLDKTQCVDLLLYLKRRMFFLHKSHYNLIRRANQLAKSTVQLIL